MSIVRWNLRPVIFGVKQRIIATLCGFSASCQILALKRRRNTWSRMVVRLASATIDNPSHDLPAKEGEDARILAVAAEAAREAGRLIVEKVGAEVVQSKAFAADLLMAVDKECEDVIRAIVSERFPDHEFLGEETADSSSASSGSLVSSEGWLWIVDPIDGTTNFAAGQPLSAVSIGIAYAGQLRVGVIHDPFRDELFSATCGGGAQVNGTAISVSGADALVDAVVASGAPPNPCSAAPCLRAMSLLAPPRSRTLRILGSAAINFAWVACGRLDAYFEPDLNSWDSAAGALIVQEAGGRVTSCVGEPYNLTTRLVILGTP